MDNDELLMTKHATVKKSEARMQGGVGGLDCSGRILLQTPPGHRTSTPSPSPQEERGGERRPILLDAPLPDPLPTRSSRGEGAALHDSGLQSSDFIRHLSFVTRYSEHAFSLIEMTGVLAVIAILA